MDSKRVNAIRPKWEKKVSSTRMNKESSFKNISLNDIKSYFKEHNTHLKIINLKCDHEALGIYINVNEYEEKVENVNDDNEFEAQIKHLWEFKL